MPEPPLKTVEVWGDISENVPDYDAPEYLDALQSYYAEFGFAEIELVSGAVSIVSGTDDIEDLQRMGVLDTNASPLPFITQDKAELQSIVEAVFYNSTVTPQGIAEAAEMFGVRWQGGLINPLIIPPTGATANGIYGDWIAARWGGYRWDEFCELAGPRQSEIVALYRIDNRLQMLMIR